MNGLSVRVKEQLTAWLVDDAFGKAVIAFPQPAAEWLAEFRPEYEWGAIAHLLPWVFSTDKTAATLSAQTIHALTQTLDAQRFVRLDSAVRENYRYASPDKRALTRWVLLNPSAVDAVRGISGELDVVGWTASHSSGFVRHAAVRRLAEFQDTTELPFLILRLNDWVPQVRAKALEAITSRLTSRYAEAFARHIDLLDRLSIQRRDDFKGVLAAVHKLLRSPEGVSAIRQSLESPARRRGRRYYKLAAETEALSIFELIRRSLQENDTLIRLWGARLLCSPAGQSYFEELAPILEADAFMPVRRAAFLFRLKMQPEREAAALRKALLDPHFSIRWIAQLYLKEKGKEHCAQFYRQALGAPGLAQKPAAIAGLGETGGLGDDALIAPWLDTGGAEVRAAAMRALNRLAPEEYRSVFVFLLSSEVPRLGRWAARLLRQHILTGFGPDLWTLITEDPRALVQWRALELLDRLGHWESVHYLLRACTLENESLAKRARGKVLQLYNQGFVVPTPAQAQAVRNAFSQLPPGIFTKEQTAWMLARIQRLQT